MINSFSLSSPATIAPDKRICWYFTVLKAYIVFSNFWPSLPEQFCAIKAKDLLCCFINFTDSYFQHKDAALAAFLSPPATSQFTFTFWKLELCLNLLSYHKVCMKSIILPLSFYKRLTGLSLNHHYTKLHAALSLIFHSGWL